MNWWQILLVLAGCCIAAYGLDKLYDLYWSRRYKRTGEELVWMGREWRKKK